MDAMVYLEQCAPIMEPIIAPVSECFLYALPTVSPYTVEQVTSPEAFEEALQIRFDVFIKEQFMGPDVESDEWDNVATHYLVRDAEGNAIATSRLVRSAGLEGQGRVERVAVVENYRGKGVGRLLLQHIEQDAISLGYRALMMYSQLPCQGFYKALGYCVIDPTVVQEHDVPVIHMEKTLP